MAYFAGLDVSVKETRVCIVDDAGKIVREARVASEPDALLQMLTIYRLQANWAESRTPVAMALQRSRRSGLAGDLR
jgi:predicted NBD/HSP70 family sugar kinase